MNPCYDHKPCHRPMDDCCQEDGNQNWLSFIILAVVIILLLGGFND